MITAIVSDKSYREALWDSFGANSQHGLPLSSIERQNVITVALVAFPEASSRRIAKHVGCSQHTVRKIKTAMQERGDLDVDDNRDAEDDSTAQSAHVNSETKPKRVVGADGKFYLAKKNKPKLMKSFGELADSLPYSYDEQEAAQAIVNAVFALPSSLTLRVHEGRLIVTSTDPDKPTLRDCPLQRGIDWEQWPLKPFFKLSASDLETLDNNGIRTIGDLAMLISTDPKEQKSLPKFGKKKLADLEAKFEEFWTTHPELCE